MVLAAEVVSFFIVLRSILTKRWHQTAVNEHAGGLSATSVERSRTFLRRTLKASSAFGTAEVALEIQTSAVDGSHTKYLVHSVLVDDEGFRCEKCAATMNLLVVISRQEWLPRVVVRTHGAWLSCRLSDLDANLLLFLRL